MANIPGQYDVATYQPVEIRAIPRDDADLILPVTIAPNANEIAIGTILGMVTATKLFVPYSKDATDGSNKAKAVLSETVPASTVPQNASAFAKAIFYKDKLIGLDAQAITDLGAREPVPNILIV